MSSPNARTVDARELHDTGLNALRRGDVRGALETLTRAVQSAPSDWEIWRSYATALAAANRLPEAVAVFERLAALQPGRAEVWGQLGNALQDLGRLQAAADCFRQALALNPDDPGAFYNLGNALLRMERPAEAIEPYRKALELQPDHPEAWSNLGTAYQELGKLDEAILAIRQAVARRPDYAEAHYNLGNALQELGKRGEAESSFRKAAEHRLGFTAAMNNLGNCLRSQHRHEEAERVFRDAIATDPGYASAHNGLGLANYDRGRFDKVIEHYLKAIQLKPDFPEARKNLGLAWLIAGDFDRGWAEYEWRWRCKDMKMPSLPRPYWDGSDPKGKTLLLLTEQGAGDSLQFIRYAGELQARGARAIVAAPRAFAGILSACDSVDRVVPHGELAPDFDAFVPLLSVPRLLGTNLDSIPGRVPYLRADPARVERWRAKLSTIGGFKIGIAWKGSKAYPGDRHRSIPLAQFAALARIDGVRLISLQKGEGLEQLGEVAGRFELIDLARDLDQDGDAFMDTAAVMESLDLVIGCDSAIIHLAGALARPVWLPLSTTCDWRWMLDREDSPWYPTLRLFRQTCYGDWERVFQRMARELPQIDHQRLGPCPNRISIAISVAELLDRIAGLRSKDESAWNEAEAAEVQELERIRDRVLRRSDESHTLIAAMIAVRRSLRALLEQARELERLGDFGSSYQEILRNLRHEESRRSAWIKTAATRFPGPGFNPDQDANPPAWLE